MKPSKKPLYPDIPAHLLAAIEREFPGDAVAFNLFSEFLDRKSYDRSFALALMHEARRSGSNSWEARRLAVLMLEHQILRIPESGIDELDLILVELGLKPRVGRAVPLYERVVKEGYSSTVLKTFAAQLRRKLQRLERIHKGISGKRTSESALQDLIDMSRRDCRLSLARYVFRPKEVVDRIISQVRVSRGALDIEPDKPAFAREQIQRVRESMPEYESEILDGLSKTGSIYWVDHSTPSELNSLVEYPLTTVVLVVKPPGSDIEFEIKRVGRRGPNPLSAVFYRGEYEVPMPHQLDGGSMQWLLRHEATMSARLASIYHIVQGVDAPVSTFMQRSAIYGVPTPRGEDYIAAYFTNPDYFRGSFKRMRGAMKLAVDSAKPKDEYGPLDAAGDLGLTVQFLAHVTPGQGILHGTSSFRLDKLAAYLSEGGAELYFKTGLKVEYSGDAARRLADELLDELLGVYETPLIAYKDHKKYVDAALSVPANREQADRAYFSIVEEIGRFWGTLWGARGYTWGESFVGRNVGLRSVWEGGEWRIKVIFMDHDNLNLPESDAQVLYPQTAFHGFCIDARFVGGVMPDSTHGQAELDLLKVIYRIDQARADKGRELLFESMKCAYRRTQREIRSNPRCHRFFDKLFIERIRDWDVMTAELLALNGDEAKIDDWKQRIEEKLINRGYTPNSATEHVAAMFEYLGFISRQAFLYEPSLDGFGPEKA